MPVESKQDWIGQLRRFLPTLPIDIMPDVLDQCPLDVRTMVWQIWANTCDISGLSLPVLLDAMAQEPQKAVYHIIKVWLVQVDMKWYSLEQVTKMSRLLTTYSDVESLWVRWAKHTDLKRYELVTFAKIIQNVPPTLSIKLADEWLRQNGAKALWDFSDNRLSKLRSMGLPKPIREQLNAALYSDPARQRSYR